MASGCGILEKKGGVAYLSLALRLVDHPIVSEDEPSSAPSFESITGSFEQVATHLYGTEGERNGKDGGGIKRRERERDRMGERALTQLGCPSEAEVR